MKTRIIIGVFLLLSASVMGQYKPIEQIFNKYSGKEGYTSVVITKAMFNLFADIETTDDDEYMNMIKNLSSIRILSCESGPEKCQGFYSEILSVIDPKVFEELMVIQDTEQNIKFLVRKKEGKVIDLVVLVGGNQDNTLIWISGVIDMKTIGKLAKNLNVEGMDKLETIKDE